MIDWKKRGASDGGPATGPADGWGGRFRVGPAPPDHLVRRAMGFLFAPSHRICHQHQATAMRFVKIALAYAMIGIVAPLLADEAGQLPAPSPSPTRTITPAERAELVQQLRAMSMLIQYRQGKISLTPDEVQQYKKILKKARHAKELAANALGPQAPHLMVRSIPLEQFAQAYSLYAGKTVIVADRAKKVLISMTVSAANDAEIVPLIESQLGTQGIAVTRNSQGLTLDFASVQP